MTKPPFVLSAFTMSTASHGNFGMWRHPDDRTSDYTDLRYWTELATLLDAGGFDLLFIADAVGQLDVFGGDADGGTRPGGADAGHRSTARRIGDGRRYRTTWIRRHGVHHV